MGVHRSDDTVETYHSNGNLLSITWRGGYVQTLNFDANGWLTSVTDSLGRQLSFTLANGRIATMIDPDGRVYRYNYDSINAPTVYRLSEVVYPDETPLDDTDNPRVQYVYEDARYPYALTGIIDENGVRYASWIYDDALRAISSEHAGGAGQTTIAYDDTDDSRTVINPLGKQTTYRFARIQQKLKVTQVDGLASLNCPAASRQTTYDANGFVASTTDWNGNLTSYVNDSRGRPTSRTEAANSVPASRTVTTAWHPDFRLPTRVVEPGRTVDFTYDAEGRLLRRTETDTTSQTIPYSTNGQTRSWSYTYTPEGLLASMDGPRTDVSDVTAYTFNAFG
jgi:YD repeat-containing protein